DGRLGGEPGALQRRVRARARWTALRRTPRRDGNDWRRWCGRPLYGRPDPPAGGCPGPPRPGREDGARQPAGHRPRETGYSALPRRLVQPGPRGGVQGGVRGVPAAPAFGQAVRAGRALLRSAAVELEPHEVPPELLRQYLGSPGDEAGRLPLPR